MTRVRVLYRLPAVVTVDLDRGKIESVRLDNEVPVGAWTGACADERGGRTMRGARQEEIDRALTIVAENPWPAAKLVTPVPSRGILREVLLSL